MIWLDIQRKLDKLPKKTMTQQEQDFVKRYLGTDKRYLGVKTRDMLEIAKGVSKELDTVDMNDVALLLDQLFSAGTFEEHAIGGKIFTLLTPDERWKIPLTKLEQWLSRSNGWVEIDVICQSSYSGTEVVTHLPSWEKMMIKFRKSPLISLRRASLVLQTRSNREINNQQMRALAFETTEILKNEKEGLITKAISWLLRSLTTQNKEEVKKYLLAKESSLPRIAFRETMRKIDTGKK